MGWVVGTRSWRPHGIEISGPFGTVPPGGAHAAAAGRAWRAGRSGGGGAVRRAGRGAGGVAPGAVLAGEPDPARLPGGDAESVAADGAAGGAGGGGVGGVGAGGGAAGGPELAGHAGRGIRVASPRPEPARAAALGRRR